MRFRPRAANSVYARLFLVLCIVAVPTVAGLILYAYHERNHNLADSKRAAQEYVERVAQYESWLIKGYEQTLIAIQATPIIANRDWAGCQRYVARLLKSHDQYVNLGVIGLNGQMLCSGTDAYSYTQKNLADRDYFQRALEQPGFVLSNYLFGRLSNKPLMLVAKALRGADDKPHAVLFAALNLQELAAPKEAALPNRGAYMTIVDRHGTILFSTKADNAPGKKASWDGPDEAVPSHGHAFRRFDGTLWFTATASAGADDDPGALSVRYAYPAAPLLGIINRAFWIELAVVLGLFALMLAVGWVVAQAIIGRNIKVLIDATKQMQEHNFNTRIAPKVSGNEFTEIASHFDKMAEAIRDREDQSRTTIRLQKEQNTILQQAIGHRSLGRTLAALVAHAQEQVQGASVGIRLADPEWSKLAPPAPDGKGRSSWSVPITSSDGNVLGSMSFYGPAGHKPSNDERQLGQTAAWFAAVVLDRYHTAAALRQSEEQYRLLFETNPHPMWVRDHNTLRILAVNNQAISHYGYSREEFLNMSADKLIVQAGDGSGAGGDPGDDSGGPGSGGENGPAGRNLVIQTHRTKSGQHIVVEVSLFPLLFQGHDARVALINDITTYREHSRALQYRARHDVVTGLLNRSSFLEHLHNAMATAKTNRSAFYVVILSLTELKEISLSMGFAVSDQILQKASKRLAQAIGPDTLAARLSGDEFAILIKPGAARFRLTLIRDLNEKMQEPFNINGSQIQVSPHIGAARYPSDGDTVGLLLKHASSAVAKAKAEGFGHTFYDGTEDSTTPDRVMLAAELLRGLNEKEFELYYQPKIPLWADGTYGFEALARWNSPGRGLLTPGDFMSVIETGSLIHAFTLWVLNSAIEQCKAWHAAGYEVTVAVNMSARNLFDLLLPERIRQVLSQHGFPARYLELEITESSIMPDPDRSLSVLRKVRDMGVAVAIDDFGTGYSSLSYIQKLPVSNLKIDRSFIVGMDFEEDTRPIIKSIIEMAHNLKLTVTAEGIETRQTMAKLAGMQCDYAQGYYISRPLSARDATTWLADHVAQSEPANPNPEKPQ